MYLNDNCLGGQVTKLAFAPSSERKGFERIFPGHGLGARKGVGGG